MSVKSVLHELIDKLPDAAHLKDALHKEVDVTDVPDTPPAEKEGE